MVDPLSTSPSNAIIDNVWINPSQGAFYGPGWVVRRQETSHTYPIAEYCSYHSTDGVANYQMKVQKPF